MLSCLEVVGVGFVGIGFALEGDGAVGFVRVPETDEEDEVFDEVGEIEEDEEEFLLLFCVDEFVGEVGGAELGFLADEDYAEEVDGFEAGEWDEGVSDYEHGCGFVCGSGTA